MDNYTVTIDHAQRRINGNRDRLSLTMSGMGLSSEYWSDTWIDPVTHTAMLRPAPMYKAFWTSNAGIYAKLGAGALTLSGTDWVEKVRFTSAGSFFITSTAGATMKTASALTKNRGVFVAWHQYSAGDTFLNFTCGWSSGTTTASGVVLEVYSNGQVIIYKDGAVVQSVDLKFQNEDLNWVLLIPGRRRELLIIAQGANGERVVFGDITEADVSPTITPAQPFFIKNGVGSIDAQIVPLKFQSTGYLTSDITSFSEAPDALDTLETWSNESWAGGASCYYRIFGHQSYAGTVGATLQTRTSTDAAEFSADGVTKSARLRFTLTGDGNYTPFIYGGHVAYAGNILTTGASEQYDEFMQFCQSPRVEIGDDDQGAHFSFTLRNLADAESHVAAITRQVNRPFKLKLGSAAVLDGVLSPQVWTTQPWDESESQTFQGRDYWALLEDYMFVDKIPLDGLTWVNALRLVLGAVGWDVSETSTGQGPAIDITNPSLTLSSVPSPDSADFGLCIHAGDTAAKWVTQLMQDYAATWEYGFWPTSVGIKFFAKSQSDLGTTPFITLYSTIAEAISVGGYSASEAYLWVYSNYIETEIEPEANDVRVTGQDMRTRRPIQAFKRDEDAIAVDTVPSARPDNWSGFPRRVGLVSPALNTQSEVNSGTVEIFDRTSPVQYHCEFACRWPDVSNVPLWKSHNVHLYGLGTVRVTSLVGEIISDIPVGLGAHKQIFRTARVCARYLPS